MNIVAFLAEHGIAYERFDHPAVFTCEQSEQLAPVMPGVGTKNLFLRDDKNRRRFLVVVAHRKSADLKELKKVFGVQKLSFGSPELLKECLGAEPGAVTLLGLVRDSAHVVEVVIDQAIWDADAIGCHPLVNTATLVIPHEGLVRFLQATGHAFKVIDVPARIVSP